MATISEDVFFNGEMAIDGGRVKEPHITQSNSDDVTSSDEYFLAENLATNDDQMSNFNGIKHKIPESIKIKDYLMAEDTDMVVHCSRFGKKALKETSLCVDMESGTKYREKSMSPSRRKVPQTPLSASMMNLTNSLTAINMISFSKGMIRAKQAFLRKLSESQTPVLPPSPEDLSREGAKAWEQIRGSQDMGDLDLCIADIDFSDLEVDVVAGEIDLRSGDLTRGGVPPPPPPPPPNIASTKKVKTVKFHWEPINRVNQATLWQNLPPVSIDKEEFIKLFEVKEELPIFTKKPNELLVLEFKRSTAVNIAIRKLPPLGSLKTTILRMDNTVINREGVEKLQSLIPSEKEIEKIKQAKQENPDIPLGSAEKFLFKIGSIPGIEARLNLWKFKMDFETMLRNICEPLSCLKKAVDILSTNQTFLSIISVTLSLGNILNKTNKPAFELESLAKLSTVKATGSKKTLLYHIANKVSEIQPNASDLYSEIEPLVNVSKVYFEELETNLSSMEQECKTSLGYIKLAAKFDIETKKLVTLFLSNAAERIMSMKRVHQLLMVKYSGFLDWLGLPKHQHGYYAPTKLATIITDFAMEYRTTLTKVNMDKKIKLSARKIIPPVLRCRTELISTSSPNFKLGSSKDKFGSTSGPNKFGTVPNTIRTFGVTTTPINTFGTTTVSGCGKDGRAALLAAEAVSFRKKINPKIALEAGSNDNHSSLDIERRMF